jgi:hypothetical protein
MCPSAAAVSPPRPCRAHCAAAYSARREGVSGRLKTRRCSRSYPDHLPQLAPCGGAQQPKKRADALVRSPLCSPPMRSAPWLQRWWTSAPTGKRSHSTRLSPSTSWTRNLLLLRIQTRTNKLLRSIGCFLASAGSAACSTVLVLFGWGHVQPRRIIPRQEISP